MNGRVQVGVVMLAALVIHLSFDDAVTPPSSHHVSLPQRGTS